MATLLVAWWILADRLVARPVLPPPGDSGQFTSVDSVRTYYRVAGLKPTLVLLHGLGLSHLTWDATTPALAEHFTAYSLDLPGFGHSDKPVGYA